MKRFVAKVAYDGKSYFGFQRQPKPTATVQRALEEAIARVTWQPITVLAAGRTDAGVHALGQVIAFDADWNHRDKDLLRAINAELPMDIALQELWQQADFHPRFDALWRQYVYRIATPATRNPLLNGRVWQFVGQSVDMGALQDAAALCLGERGISRLLEPRRRQAASIRFARCFIRDGIQKSRTGVSFISTAFARPHFSITWCGAW